MGTIFLDSSHFAAFRRGILQRQATVIATGPFPRLSPEKSAHFLWEMLVTAKPSGCPLDLSQEISPLLKFLPGRSALRTIINGFTLLLAL